MKTKEGNFKKKNRDKNREKPRRKQRKEIMKTRHENNIKKHRRK